MSTASELKVSPGGSPARGASDLLRPLGARAMAGRGRSTPRSCRHRPNGRRRAHRPRTCLVPRDRRLRPAFQGFTARRLMIPGISDGSRTSRGDRPFPSTTSDLGDRPRVANLALRHWNCSLGGLASLSLAYLGWKWVAGTRFPPKDYPNVSPTLHSHPIDTSASVSPGWASEKEAGSRLTPCLPSADIFRGEERRPRRVRGVRASRPVTFSPFPLVLCPKGKLCNVVFQSRRPNASQSSLVEKGRRFTRTYGVCRPKVSLMAEGTWPS